MYYLTTDAVIRLNKQLMIEANEHFAVLFHGTLEGCVEKAKQVLYGVETYQDIYEKAAALLHCIIARSPFENGNKRTGIAAALTFLEMNGIAVLIDVEESKQLTLRIAESSVGIPEIARWLRAHTKQPSYVA